MAKLENFLHILISNIRYLFFIIGNFLKAFVFQWTFLVSVIIAIGDNLVFYLPFFPKIEPSISRVKNTLQVIQTPFPIKYLLIFVLALISLVKVYKNKNKIITIKKEKILLSKHTFKINKLILSSDQKILASASDRKVIVWNIESRSILQTLQCQTWVGNILFTNNDQNVIGIGGKGMFFDWDILSGNLNCEVILESTESVALSKTYNDDLIATANKKGIISIWRYPELSKIDSFSMGNHEIRKISFSFDEENIIGCDISGKVSIFSLKDKTETVLFSHPKNSPIRFICFSPTGFEISFIDGDGYLYLFNLIDHNIVCNVKAHNDMGLCCEFNKDGKYIASGGQDNEIIIWKRSKNRFIKKLIISGHSDAVTTLVFDRTNNLYSASRDKLIKYWNIGKFLY